MWRRIIPLLLLIGCHAGRAVAGDPALDAREVMRANQYDGVWSMDCSRVPTDPVPRINWVVPDHGPVQQWVDIGHGYFREGTVSAASVAPDGRFTIAVQSLSGWSWVRTTIRVDDQRIRIWEMTRTWRGRTRLEAKDGHIIHDGMRSPPIERCDEPGALTS